MAQERAKRFKRTLIAAYRVFEETALFNDITSKCRVGSFDWHAAGNTRVFCKKFPYEL
jgi:hypothetical protein